ncbi:MAG: Ni/Fe hydrogenase subunit alpha [bacterium]|nr:Ni/Fe hydrogenase subunit alpha [Candidatus Sumerlaeota bacterium]
MPKQIVIDPVTRIEGHGRITIQLGDDGVVQDAHFHVTQLRGFEKFCEGRPFEEMPSLMARICGICPVSHLIAAAKACDALLAVRIPPTAIQLRRIINMAQIVQSHALSFFHLSSPDLLLGMDFDPVQRNIFGVLQRYPDLARDGIRLRRFGQQIIEWLGGKRIHPSWVVPGGVNEPLTEQRRNQILATIPEALEIIVRTLDWFRTAMGIFQEEIATFANFPTLYMGLVNEDGEPDYYDGRLRVVDSAGNVINDGIEAAEYHDYIGEYVEPHSFLKSPFYIPLGYPEGIYRVGPLARLNVADRLNEPKAYEEWSAFRELGRRAVQSSFYYHYARLIEILFCIERLRTRLSRPDILNKHVRAYAEPNSFEGVGMSEAPRGMLLHHYKIDEQGLVTWANLIIATGHNNLAMNRGVLQAAKHFVKGNKIEEPMLNRVEAVIRCYDPCLSCSTHAIGKMPLHVQLVSADGGILDEIKRG